MDDLLLEFLTETNESLDVVDVELVKFEQEPNNAQILDNIFRLVHTIKGTCGFLGLPRLEALAHAAETLMGKFRDGVPVTPDAVSLILTSIDRIKELLAELESAGQEPAGEDRDLISELERMAGYGDDADEAAPDEDESATSGDVVFQVLERELRPGEVSLDELERAFREAEGPEGLEMTAPEVEEAEPAPAEAEPEPVAAKEPKTEEKAKSGGEKSEKSSSVSNQSIRVNVETLEHLMTMVSELVLTRNQLLEIVRRHEESEFKVPLQRLSNVTAELQEGVMKTRMQP
ncbi:MAG: Hpt domain-containing protein, partial [Hyphomicrobiales bacterium]|nr:Hpt domain-containing protein [Hyphomicrobiales bacterium]